MTVAQELRKLGLLFGPCSYQFTQHSPCIAAGIVKVIYSSGNVAQASNTGTITGVQAGISYDIKVCCMVKECSTILSQATSMAGGSPS